MTGNELTREQVESALCRLMVDARPEFRPLVKDLEETDAFYRQRVEALEQEAKLHHDMWERHKARERFMADLVYEHIQHGDEKHREWLRKAIDEVMTIEGKPHERLDTIQAQLRERGERIARLTNDNEALEAKHAEDYLEIRTQRTTITRLERYLASRKLTIEASLSAEVLAGNEAKCAVERAALVEITETKRELQQALAQATPASSHSPGQTP